MKPLTLSNADCKKLDKKATEEFFIPSCLLMENAGRGLAEHVRNVLGKFPLSAIVVILCGGGKNGGDGLVAARYIQKFHPRVRIYLIQEPSKLTGDTLTNYKIAKKWGLDIHPYSQFKKDQQTLFQNTPLVIIDAILGLGFQPPIRPAIDEIIKTVNHLKKFHNTKAMVVAVDIPTGMDADKGVPAGASVLQADVTVTMACLKPGLVHPSSKPYVGKLEVVDIGVPDPLSKSFLK